MKRFLVISLSLFFAVSAQAGLNRTAVSLFGSDANPCSLQQPCATFAKAIMQTNPDGELIALDSGGYDGFTIDKAMTVTAAPGAVVTVGKDPLGSWGIRVNAPGKLVTIRGLMVRASTFTGITAYDAAVTHIDNVYIEGIGCATGCSPGIFGRRGRVVVNNTRVRNTFSGIVHNPLEASTMLITDTVIDNTQSTGIIADNYAIVTARNTVVTNGGYGASASSLAADGKPLLTLIDCTFTSNTAGVNVGNLAVVRLEDSAVTRNTTGLQITGSGVLITHGNNLVAGNTTDVSGPVTTAGLM